MTWLKSDYDHQVHVFVPTIGAGSYVEALCKHSAPPAKLHPYVDGDRFCRACLVAFGEQIPEDQSHGDAL